MSEHSRDEWGVSPPYGAYGGAYGSYPVAQFASMGSGLLGGWNAVGDGLIVEDAAPDEEDLRQELKQLVAAVDEVAARETGTPPHRAG